MVAPDSTTTRRPKPWLLSFFALLAIGGLISMPILAGPPRADEMPDIVRFIGHFHPMLLHLPIGVFALIILQELGAIFGRRHHDHVANRSMFPLLFGALSAILAVIAGFMLFHGGEEYAGNELVERHMWAGLVFAIGAVVTFILKAWTVALEGNPAFYRLLLFTSVAVMGFASHDGGSITHGGNYLTEFAPDPLRSVLGLPKKNDKNKPAPGAQQDAEPVFASVIAPILERRCVQCHKESKAKGKLRMDTYEMLVKGGKEGPAIEPGNAEKSNILVRAILPEDDDERMPPEGKPGMDPNELAVIRWWIDQGADPMKSLKDYDVPAPVQQALASLLPVSHGTPEVSKAPTGDAPPHAPAAGPDDALKASVAGISKEFPGALSFESQHSPLLTFTAVSLRGNLTDDDFKKLVPVTPQLVTVDLSATKITDAAVAQLADSKNLRLVRLAETGVTDAAIDSLVKIPSLQSINLYGTKVTDAGVSKLEALPNLKHLYLWKTAVSPATIQSLKEKMPDCEIVTGIDS